MADPTVRPANAAILIRLMANDTDLAAPDPTTDAIPFEVDSVNRNSPFTTEQTNEATGSFVTGAPLVVGQAATVSFRSRIKGAGVGAVYSPTVKPPLHAALAACGRRPLFTAAIVAALATAGTASSATLAAAYPATARSLIGMPLVISAGAGSGATALVVDYSATKVAALGDTFAPALDATSSIAVPANWTYAGTSPSDAAARTTDHPLAIIYYYRDGQLWKWTHCRGVVGLDGRSARPGFGAFSFTGIFAGRVDAAVPANLVVANHMAPTLVKGSDQFSVALLNRKPVPIATWSLDAGAQPFSTDDPNTKGGYGGGEIPERTPMLKMDPLATLVAARDTLSDIAGGVAQSAVLRHGSQAGNRWSLTVPRAQPVGEEDGTREKLLSEQVTLQALSLGRDPVLRDTDSVLCFF